MKSPRILVVGGSGFLGRHLIARLGGANRPVLVPTRRRERARHLILLPTVEVVQTRLDTDAAIDALMSRASAVVNLVGILHGNHGEPYGSDFARAHVELPRRLAAACVRNGVRRLVHVSALGVSEDRDSLPSMYLRSKSDGERAIRETPGLEWTIFRPSVVFGPEDRFLNLFAKLQRSFPVMPIARAGARFQPVYVGDVSDAIAGAIENPATFGKVYELAGPEVFTLEALVRLAGTWSGNPRPVIRLPYTLGQIQSSMLEVAPGETMMSRDNFDSMAIDNVASGPIAPELGVTPTPLATIAPQYLSTYVRYTSERSRAHR